MGDMGRDTTERLRLISACCSAAGRGLVYVYEREGEVEMELAVDVGVGVVEAEYVDECRLCFSRSLAACSSICCL